MIGNLMYCLTLCTDELCTNNTFEASVEKTRNKESNYSRNIESFYTKIILQSITFETLLNETVDNNKTTHKILKVCTMAIKLENN